MSTDAFSHKPWILFGIVLGTLGGILASLFILYTREQPIIASDVRIKNETGVELLEVRVNGVAYGDLAIDGLSKYQTLASAYRYAHLELQMQGRKIEIRPEDYVGETPLGKGYFTYKIQNRTAAEGFVDIQALADLD